VAKALAAVAGVAAYLLGKGLGRLDMPSWPADDQLRDLLLAAVSSVATAVRLWLARLVVDLTSGEVKATTMTAHYMARSWN
jgi:hypothetical protein